MKKHIIHRAGALVLALVLALTLAVPGWAAGVPDTTESTSAPENAAEQTVVGKSGKETAAVVGMGNSVIPVTTGDGSKTAAYAVSPVATTYTVAVESVTLRPTTLTLDVGGSGILTATIAPNNATNQKVTWTSSDNTVATVSEGGKVTAMKSGKATITVTTEDGKKTATCEVTVNPAPINLVLASSCGSTWGKDSGALILRVYLTGDGLPENPVISWTVSRKSAQDRTNLPEIEETTTVVDGASSITVPTKDPGDFVFTATYTQGNVTYTKTVDVTISGIVLSGARLNDSETGGVKDSMEMYLNDNTTLTLKRYGLADDGNNTVDWMSSDSSVVYAMGGTLTSQGLGKAIITASTRSGYSAQCSVEVVEDKSIIAGPYTASVSKPLIIGDIYADLNTICENKTRERSETDPPTASPLRYINNLKVSPNQGTLYYLYSSEGDTGAGVGSADQFAKTASGTIKSADRLYFVPKSGFVGTAEITFQGVAVNGYNFSGTIKVNVGVGSDDEDGDNVYQISYRARAGEPAWFMASDFNAFCKSVTGRSFNSVTFSLPKSSEGVLYMNYMAGSGTPVTTTTKFTPSGTYTLDKVCFVPNAAFAGKSVTISFHVVDTAGETKEGKLEVEVIPADVDGDPSNVTISGEQGQPITLQSELFGDACRDTINDTLSFVIFKLPDPSEGVLYYNYQSNGSYDSRVTAFTRYYYSGVPGISGVTFVPNSGATGRIAISYTGYGSTGTSYAGTLYISMDEANSSTIRYSVEKYGSVTFKASDFYNAGLYQKGIGVDYVLLSVPSTDLGKLRYDYQSSSKPGSVVSGGTYYVSPNSWQSGLNLLSFHAEGLTGTVTIDYTAYCGTGTSQQTFSGKVVIQVGAIAAEAVNISCSTGGQVGLSSHSLSSACDPVMSASLSYIEITSVPASGEGHLYLNYYGYGTGTVVKPGDRFYRIGSPSIDRLTFVPNANFTGKTEITYIGYSGDGQERVSGRVIVNVSSSKTSSFNDMSGYEWAVDAVEFLRQNGTVQGTGSGSFNPGGTIIRGDFTLMLVRGYSLTAGSGVSFKDVPANSYYADAIRIASALRIINGYNGYFSPQAPLTRQDAMVIIYNTLKASGKSVTNGLAADFSAYHDEGEIAPYAREAIGSLLQMGIVKGNGNGYLQPQSQLTRAQAAVLLHAIMTL